MPQAPELISTELADPAPDGVATLRRRAVRGGALLISTRVLTQLFMWASTLLVARFLMREDYGLMGIGLLIVGLADLCAEAGIGRALIQKEKLEPRDVDEGFTLFFILAATIYTALFVLAEPLATYVFDAPELPTFLRVLGIHVLLAPFMGIPLALLDRNLNLGRQSAIHAGTAVIQSVLVLTLAILGMGYWSLVAGSLTRRVLEVTAYMTGSGWRPRLVALGYRVKGLLHFGIHVSLGTFLWYLYTNVDYAVVGRFAGIEILGLYTLAFQLASLPAEKLTANISKVAYPAFCRLQNDRERLHDWFVRLLVLIGFVGMPAMVGMALVAEDGLIVVLGDKWRGAVLPFQLLSLSGLFRIYSAMFPMLFNALGRPELNLRFNFFCAVVFPVCYVLAAISWGMTGVCLVWMILFPLAVTCLIHVTRRATTVGVGDLVWSQRVILGCTALMAAAVLALQWSLPETPRGIRLLGAIAVGVIGYAVPMYVLCRRTLLADLRTLWKDAFRRGGNIEKVARKEPA